MQYSRGRGRGTLKRKLWVTPASQGRNSQVSIRNLQKKNTISVGNKNEQIIQQCRLK